MKYYFSILLISLVMFACNNASDSNSGSDSLSVREDSGSNPRPASIDTSNLRRDTPNVDSALRK